MAEPKPAVLFADDEWEIAGWDRVLTRKLPDVAFRFESRANAVLDTLRQHPEIECLVLDITFAGQEMQGLDVLTLVRTDFPDLPVIMFTADTSPSTAATFGRAGVFDYFSKENPDLQRLRLVIQNAANQTRMARRLKTIQPDAMLGVSPACASLRRMIDTVARLPEAVLILGESGVGKTLVAQAIHAASPRAAKPLVHVSPADYPSNVLESALFGHRRGAFTDAKENRKGLLAEADGGTLFLDEIGELTPDMQSRLLHFLQEKKFRPLGDNKEYSVDARLIFATHQNLERMVKENRMRHDFYFRISQLAVEVPPLRDREGDIELLASWFLLKKREAGETAVRGIASEAMEILRSYPWPGNVRELQNAIAYAVIQAQLQQSAELKPHHFRLGCHRPIGAKGEENHRSIADKAESAPIVRQSAGLMLPVFNTRGMEIESIVAKVRLHYCQAALESVQWKKSEVHKLLGLTSRFSFKKLVEKDLGVPGMRDRYPQLAAAYPQQHKGNRRTNGKAD